MKCMRAEVFLEIAYHNAVFCNLFPLLSTVVYWRLGWHRGRNTDWNHWNERRIQFHESRCV